MAGTSGPLQTWSVLRIKKKKKAHFGGMESKIKSQSILSSIAATLERGGNFLLSQATAKVTSKL